MYSREEFKHVGDIMQHSFYDLANALPGGETGTRDALKVLSAALFQMSLAVDVLSAYVDYQLEQSKKETKGGQNDEGTD